MQYDKDDHRSIPDLAAAIPLAFMQKEPRFALEKEWRLAVLLSGSMTGSPPYIDVTVPLARPLELFQV